MAFEIKHLLENVERIQESSSSDAIVGLYFSKYLDCSSSIKENYRENTNQLYKAIAESNNDLTIVNEAFEEFFTQMKDTINQFSRFTTKTYNNFNSGLIKRIKNDKFITDNKEYFLNYPEDKKFILEREKFINLDSGIPKRIVKLSYEKEYTKLEKILSSKSSSQEKITSLIYEYNSFIDEISGGYYDNFRGDVLALEKPVSRAEFSKTLYDRFREPDKLTEVNSNDVKESYLRLTEAKKLLNTIDKEKKSIEKEYDQIKSDFNKISFANLVSTFGPDSQVLETKFDTYIKLKTDQITTISDIYMMTYCAKLDAMSCSYMQDRAVLLAAMSRREDGGEVE